MAETIFHFDRNVTGNGVFNQDTGAIDGTCRGGIIFYDNNFEGFAVRYRRCRMLPNKL
jgi:hypothetical protein